MREQSATSASNDIPGSRMDVLDVRGQGIEKALTLFSFHDVTLLYLPTKPSLTLIAGHQLAQRLIVRTSEFATAAHRGRGTR
jgi:hypothetical protein